MAAKYRRIDPRIWRDEKFRRLDIQQKLCAVYILTSPQSNRIGLFVFSPALAAAETGIGPAFPEIFTSVIASMHWHWDPEAEMIFIPRWWKWNPPQGAKVLIGNLSDLHDLPESPLIAMFCRNTAYFNGELLEAFARCLEKQGHTSEGGPVKSSKAGYPPDRYPIPTRLQEQEQKQEQDQEQEGEGGPAAASFAQSETLRNPSPGKVQFGEFGWVQLTAEQHARLKEVLVDHIDDYIARFDGWVQEAPNAKTHGVRRRDRDAYASIQNWFRRDQADQEEGRLNQGRTKTPLKLNPDLYTRQPNVPSDAELEAEIQKLRARKPEAHV